MLAGLDRRRCSCVCSDSAMHTCAPAERASTTRQVEQWRFMRWRHGRLGSNRNGWTGQHMSDSLHSRGLLLGHRHVSRTHAVTVRRRSLLCNGSQRRVGPKITTVATHKLLERGTQSLLPPPQMMRESDAHHASKGVPTISLPLPLNVSSSFNMLLVGLDGGLNQEIHARGVVTASCIRESLPTSVASAGRGSSLQLG